MADAVRQSASVTSGVVPGGGIWEVVKAFDAELVNGTAVVDSVVHTGASQLGFEVSDFRYFGLHLSATSVTGTADVKAEIIESWDDTAANYVSPDAGGTIVSSHGETAKVYSVSPVPMKKMRIRITGNAANPADTIVTAYLYRQT